jgi:hypothetical protein
MIEGIWAIVVACFSFLVPMAVPLFVQRWRTFLIILVAAAAFFGWLTLEMPIAGSIPAGIGAFLGGLMLLGFAGGAIAKFIGLVGRQPQD